MKHVRCWLIASAFVTSSALAQDPDSLLHQQDSVLINSLLHKPDSLLTAEDSLSIFTLIDSLLSMKDFAINSSQLAVRASYNSNVLSAGRTLGIKNFGLSPSLCYFHKSGFYADVSGFWSNDFIPKYYLSIASVGYIHSFSKYFSFMSGFDKYFYHSVSEDAYIPYQNTISLVPLVEVKPVTLSVNYSFYFGDHYAHRVMPGLGFSLKNKKKILSIERIAISPAFYLLWGNETFTEFEIIPPESISEMVDNIMKYGTRYRVEQRDYDVFGIMNYAITAPLTITHKKWSVNVSYTYNIPKALKGEPAVPDKSSFLSGSLSYFIDFRRK